jgi:hypothetical protein
MLINDVYRFIMYHKGATEGSLLRAWAVMLFCNLTGSLVQKLFEHGELE